MENNIKNFENFENNDEEWLLLREIDGSEEYIIFNKY